MIAKQNNVAPLRSEMMLQVQLLIHRALRDVEAGAPVGKTP